MILKPQCKTKFIFITGGVTSSLGKGLANASLGRLLLSINKDLKIKFVKCDPYLNIDPGTMNPNQHGEVYVLNDGCETDLDFGHYARFTNLHMKKGCSITAGKVYSSLLEKERRGVFLGKTVQIIPHLTNEIKELIYSNINDADGDVDFILCEIGGTVGDMEALPFLEAIRQIGYEFPQSVMYLHMTLVPYLRVAKELKTKPTQHSTSILRSIGIQPHVLLCRSEYDLSFELREKIGNFCNLHSDRVISIVDVDNVYKIPLVMQESKLDQIINDYFNIGVLHKNYLNYWSEIVEKMKRILPVVKVAVVGKYGELDDSYKSLFEALNHAGIKNDVKVVTELIDSRNLDSTNVFNTLKGFDGIVVPGGFGSFGIDGKIEAISYARKNNIPFLGICYGMQLALIEIARNVLNIEDANSTELDKNCKNPIIYLINEWKNGQKIEYRSSDDNLGGTMRLGAYDCKLSAGSLVKKVYNNEVISERHRHRYEFNNDYMKQFLDCGVVFSGLSINEQLVEIIELPANRWFVATQFHPEFKSSVTDSHPLFDDFIKASCITK
jgi:CTP synthase